MQKFHTPRLGLLAWIFFTVALLILPGCSHTPVYRGITASEAEAIVAKLAGTDKPASTTLAQYYQAEEKYTSWSGTWNCNHQLIRVAMRNLVLTAGPGNLVEGTYSTTGDSRCNSLDSDPIVGRYDENYFYLYWPNEKTTYINKYEILKSKYRKGTLAFRGQFKYIDDVWKLHDAGKNPLYGVTGQKIAESGGPADMWESTEMVPQEQDPRLTAEQRRKETLTRESREVGRIAGEIASRDAGRAADRRAANQAANAAAFAQLSQMYAQQSAQRRAEAAQPRSNLLADSQRAADAARADIERRAEAARQAQRHSTQTARLTPSAPATRATSSTSQRTPVQAFTPPRPSVTATPVLPTPMSTVSTGNQATREQSRTYTCPSSQYFTSLIHHIDVRKKEETFTFEEACARAEKQAAAFVASVGTGSSYTYSKSVVKRVDSCRKTKSGDQAVVYVHLEEPSSRPCGTPSTGMSR